MRERGQGGGWGLQARDNCKVDCESRFLRGGESMATEDELLKCFSMPSGQSITGRSSSIRNAFVAAIVPIIKPIAADVENVLRILELSPDDVRCAYCGDKATEWDHLGRWSAGASPLAIRLQLRILCPLVASATNRRENLTGNFGCMERRGYHQRPGVYPGSRNELPALRNTSGGQRASV